MMFMAGTNSVDALPDPLSLIVRIMPIEVGAISLGVETRTITGSVNAEAVTGTSGIVIVVASETTTVGTDFTILGSATKI